MQEYKNKIIQYSGIGTSIQLVEIKRNKTFLPQKAVIWGMVDILLVNNIIILEIYEIKLWDKVKLENNYEVVKLYKNKKKATTLSRTH